MMGSRPTKNRNLWVGIQGTFTLWWLRCDEPPRRQVALFPRQQFWTEQKGKGKLKIHIDFSLILEYRCNIRSCLMIFSLWLPHYKRLKLWKLCAKTKPFSEVTYVRYAIILTRQMSNILVFFPSLAYFTLQDHWSPFLLNFLKMKKFHSFSWLNRTPL